MMKLSSQVSALLTDHITLERLAEAAYRAVANWADLQAFFGLQKWADGEANDERDHQKLVTDYLRDRGVATLQSVPSPQNTFSDYAAALSYLLQVEQRVTHSVNTIMQVAMEDEDFATQQALWSLLAVQVHSEKVIQDLLIKVNRGAPIDLLDHTMFEELGG